MCGAHFFAGGKPIEIKIPKEIREYQESIFFGLNTRQFVCSLLALGVAVGLYFLLRDTAGTEIAGWACMLGAAPFAACGFVRYHGMTAEQLEQLFVPRPDTDRGIGVINVNNRIRLCFGEEYGLHYFSAPGEGTRVEIWLPVIEGGDEDDV